MTPAGNATTLTLGGLNWLTPPRVTAWVDLCAPRRDERVAVARQLCLPYQALLATLSSTTEVWCRAAQHHIVVRLPIAHRDPLSGRTQADTLDLIVGAHVVVSVHRSPLPALMCVRRRVHHAAAQGPTAAPCCAMRSLVRCSARRTRWRGGWCRRPW